jgi:hypothetical protein
MFMLGEFWTLKYECLLASNGIMIEENNKFI